MMLETILPSVILSEVADFFESEPARYTSEYVALANGQRTGYLNPQATQWDIIGAIGKIKWERYSNRIELGNLWFFKRLVRAFHEANELDISEQESTILIYENYIADTVFDVIEALRKASKYCVDNDMDKSLDLTPPPVKEVWQGVKLWL